MPGLNGTGPEGAGPMTGRRMGRCGANSNRDVEPVAGRGRGAGRGMGRGMGHGRGRGRGRGAGRA